MALIAADGLGTERHCSSAKRSKPLQRPRSQRRWNKQKEVLQQALKAGETKDQYRRDFGENGLDDYRS
jgi:hypothetical protein